MSSDTLFPITPSSRPPSPQDGDRGAPRVCQADRRQVELRACDLESLLPADHAARAIWAVVAKLDLSRFYAPIQARGSEPGRPATDPKILVALWLYATNQGVGSARELERLCEAHEAYRWICGGVSVNHHTLGDFRVDHGAALDELMTQVLGVLMHQGLLSLRRTVQDGTRVRASAGAASFRREPSLKKCLAAARTQVARAKWQAEQPPDERTARERAAQERAAREREARVTRALAELPKVQAVKPTAEKKEQARVSTTDAEARVMKMGDGGFRPAYNVQLATDTESRVIVGVAVTNVGSDRREMQPMLKQIESRTGVKPKQHLVDGGYATRKNIDAASAQGIEVFAPVKKTRAPVENRHEAKPKDTAAVTEWRIRMGTEEAQATYRERAATAETVNADLKCWRGLDRFGVRGTTKVLAVSLWSALAYNVMRALALGAFG